MLVQKHVGLQLCQNAIVLTVKPERRSPHLTRGKFGYANNKDEWFGGKLF